MFGNKENDGFLDGLARSAARVAVIFVILSVVWYLICAFFEALRTRPLVVLIWVCLIFLFFYFIDIQIEKEEQLRLTQPEHIEDTRSGQEIWNENMKDYDAERGY